MPNTRNPRIGLITKSFSGDYEICRLLCETMDRHVTAEHLLIVPRSDMSLFETLRGPRRTIVPEEDFLPRGMARAPLPGPAWRRRLGLPRRDVYLTTFSPPVRGWIAQQLVKLGAAAALDWDVVLHVDSDVAFVRPLDPTRLIRDGAVRFYRDPAAGRLPTHDRWHEVAGEVLGAPGTRYFGADYIGTVVAWSPEIVREMTARIARIAGEDWRKALARRPHFSEYILYGAFCDGVLGDAAPVFRTAEELALTRWSEALSERDEDAFVESLRPTDVSIAVQSTLGLSPERRAALVRRCEARAAAGSLGGAIHPAA